MTDESKSRRISAIRPLAQVVLGVVSMGIALIAARNKGPLGQKTKTRRPRA
jgi:hypothetical protein